MLALAPDIDCGKTIAQIVVDHPSTARVFQAHGIDFCCHGNVTIDVVCAEKEIEPALVCEQLRASLLSPVDGEEEVVLQDLSTAALIARIIDRHHGFLLRVLPGVVQLAARVARVHGDGDERLHEVAELSAELAEMLIPHLDQEEEVLFPALLSREKDRGLIEKELREMFEEHAAVGERLARLRTITDDFAAPSWGCGSYRTLMRDLLEVETDTLRHVHTENHVLMPRFI